MTTEEREALILSCVNLARSHAAKNLGRGLDYDELLSDAYLGLVESADRYKPARGTKFTTCATIGIRRTIMAGFRDRHRPLRISAHTNELLAKIRKGKTTLDDLKPGDAACARAAMIVLRMKRVAITPDDPWIMDNIPDRSPDPSDESAEVEHNERLKSTVISIMDNLSDRDRMVVILRLGLNGEIVHSFREVGKRLRMSHERARQIYLAAIQSIRDRVESDQLACA